MPSRRGRALKALQTLGWSLDDVADSDAHSVLLDEDATPARHMIVVRSGDREVSATFAETIGETLQHIAELLEEDCSLGGIWDLDGRPDRDGLVPRLTLQVTVGVLDGDRVTHGFTRRI